MKVLISKTHIAQLLVYFFLLMLFMITLFACFPIRVHKVYVPDDPAIPEIKISEAKYEGIPFNPPISPKKIVYVTKDGQPATKTIDNINVRVSSISDLAYTETKRSPYLVTIEGPDQKQYSYALFPAMLTLEIENKTDHIVTLGRTAMLTGTIIRLEDKDGSPYPLINTQDEAKRNLAQNIERAFDIYKQRLTDIDSIDLLKTKYCSEYKNIVFGSYADEFQTMKKQIDEAWADPLGETSFDAVTKDGKPYIDPEIDSSKYYADRFTPSESRVLLVKKEARYVHSMGCAKIERILKEKYQIISWENEKKAKEIDNFRDKAVKQILTIPSFQNVITSGDYPPINILPGRRAEILVPFSKAKEEEIKEIFVGIYDLPTQVDAAGIPVKRANFTFDMFAKELK